MSRVDTIEAYRLLSHVIPENQRTFLERDGAVYGLPDPRWHGDPEKVGLKLSCVAHTWVFRKADVVHVLLRRTYTPGAAGLTDVTIEEMPA